MALKGEWSDKYNPFNSLKALAHIHTWKPIQEGRIPPPFFLSIDPSGACNYDCSFCNASLTMADSPSQLSIKDINDILDLLKYWDVKAVCVGGGGEPLANPHTGYLLDLLHNAKIEIGVVTNGSMIDRFMDSLSLCKWVGVSVNAGTKETHSQMMGCKHEDFGRVLNNISALKHYGVRHGTNVEVTYKFLLHPDNYKEAFEAARLAKQYGCDLIHFRPGDDPWFEKEKHQFNFTPEQVDETIGLINSAREKFEAPGFKVYGIVHKFSPNWTALHSFKTCNATYVQCLISSSAKIELCCDRRGDRSLTLCDVKDAKVMWGSTKHQEMVKTIDVSKCPRCTLTHVNEIFENAVIEDRMMYYFI